MRLSYRSTRCENTFLLAGLETIPQAEIIKLQEEPSRLSASQLYTSTGSLRRTREACKTLPVLWLIVLGEDVRYETQDLDTSHDYSLRKRSGALTA